MMCKSSTVLASSFFLGNHNHPSEMRPSCGFSGETFYPHLQTCVHKISSVSVCGCMADADGSRSVAVAISSFLSLLIASSSPSLQPSTHYSLSLSHGAWCMVITRDDTQQDNQKPLSLSLSPIPYHKTKTRDKRKQDMGNKNKWEDKTRPSQPISK